jgi:hypothetical protein
MTDWHRIAQDMTAAELADALDAAPTNADSSEWMAGWVAEAPHPARAAFYAALPKAARDAALAALDDAWREHDRAEAVAEHGHYCPDHLEWVQVSAPCPACPGGMWAAHDAVCAVCGELLQAAGHVHGPWCARTDAAALRDELPPEAEAFAWPTE